MFSGADSVSRKNATVAAFLHRAPNRISLAKRVAGQFLGGHRALRENLLQGLTRAGIPHALNSGHPILAETRVGLLAGKRILRELISNKVRVVVGPNYVVSPRDDSETLTSELVPTVLVPSNWVADFYADEVPEIKEKLRVWTCGINTDFWRPLTNQDSSQRVSKNLLIYCKIADREFAGRVKRVLKANGYTVRVLNYGTYSPIEYRNILRQSDLLVWLGSSESQGLAQFEAWACGVPTLIFDPRSPLILPGERSTILPQGRWSPGPYLTNNRGEFWTSTDELVWLCQQHFDGSCLFSPQANLENEFSLKVSARYYADLIRG